MTSVKTTLVGNGPPRELVINRWELTAHHRIRAGSQLRIPQVLTHARLLCTLLLDTFGVFADFSWDRFRIFREIRSWK